MLANCVVPTDANRMNVQAGEWKKPRVREGFFLLHLSALIVSHADATPPPHAPLALRVVALWMSHMKDECVWWGALLYTLFTVQTPVPFTPPKTVVTWLGIWEQQYFCEGQRFFHDIGALPCWEHSMQHSGEGQRCFCEMFWFHFKEIAGFNLLRYVFRQNEQLVKCYLLLWVTVTSSVRPVFPFLAKPLTVKVWVDGPIVHVPTSQ